MSDFVDTTLLECSRHNSINKDNINSDNSFYTNRMGNVIRLDIGDRISIDSAFINQKGCADPSSIEFKGNIIGEGIFEETDGDVMYGGAGYDDNTPHMDRIVLWNKQLKTKNIQLKDNECVLPINYYKNANGEGHMFLPRKFWSKNYSEVNHTNFPHFNTSESVWNLSNSEKDNDVVNPAIPLDKAGENSGICYYMNIGTIDDIQFNSNDYHLVYVWKQQYTNPTPTPITNYQYEWRPKIDNSRYTLFIRDFFFKTNSTDDINTYEGINGDMWWKGTIPDDSVHKRYEVGDNKDPALSEYSLYQENLKIQLEEGFSTPQSISEQITQQLQEEEQDSPEEYNYTQIDNEDEDNVLNISTAIKTKLFKPYDCAGTRNFSYTNYNDFMIDATKRDTEPAREYWSSTNHIWVKRPDLFIAGRKLNNWWGWVDWWYYDTLKTMWEWRSDGSGGNLYGMPNLIQNEINHRGSPQYDNITESITTSWIYKDSILKDLNELFKIQGRYPELFSNANDSAFYQGCWTNAFFGADGKKVDMETARFLHMSPMVYDIDEDFLKVLGSDGYENRTGTITTNNQSLPIFFKYQEENADRYINEPTTDNLSYGFATKTLIDGAYYITIHPELCIGIPHQFFDSRSESGTRENIEADSCLIGWDYHYSSFGNVVMCGFTGIIPQNYDDSALVGSIGYNSHVNQNWSDYFTSSYMGSNNTALIYDNVSSKFGFEYLHTPERVGQGWSAGSTDIISPTAETTNNNPIVADAGNECYKLNKRETTFTYTSDMCPYKKQIGGSISATYNAKEEVKIQELNGNIVSYKIFDSHMGININFGRTCYQGEGNEEQEKIIWNKSLLNILGFSWEQFNPSVINNTNNGQARVKYDNIESLFNPTTNCEVVSTDTEDMVMNPYGAIQYTTQLPMSFRFPHVWGSASDDRTDLGYYPAITQNTQSIVIEAIGLPKVVIIPYLTIRTDLISENKYIGGVDSGLKFPIIAVVNKINADKDYLQLSDSNMSYTCKNPVSFSSITTQITNPDGTLADTDDGNSVIYSINKSNNTNKYNILPQILKNKK